ncbi:hypothetical protein FA95DRAFT_560997 [Auriscalpium vulgare]|uniref:Uncharacterized protein n=1 Tax=Auriscalpium vulgare TaxID=40419 RepID=A0ACB8RE78_9AGAM|nr:hypothetical protein FA95DRAFT_560997 [Auriscalpium vulgare]
MCATWSSPEPPSLTIASHHSRFLVVVVVVIVVDQSCLSSGCKARCVSSEPIFQEMHALGAHIVHISHIFQDATKHHTRRIICAALGPNPLSHNSTASLPPSSIRRSYARAANQRAQRTKMMIRYTHQLIVKTPTSCPWAMR